MLHQNSVFHGALKYVPWHKLEQSVEKHGADHLSRTLTTKRQLTALLYGQLSGATSLREIVTGMESHVTRLYHLGASPVKRSTVSDANRDRPWQVFSELCTLMIEQAHRGLLAAPGEAVGEVGTGQVGVVGVEGAPGGLPVVPVVGVAPRPPEGAGGQRDGSAADR